MRRPVFKSSDEVAEMVFDGATVTTIGMTLAGASEEILKALEESFLSTGHPRNLTLVHSAGQSDRMRGIQHLAHEGMVARIIGSHWGLQPRWMEMISNNQVVAYCMPQGQMAQLYRSMACGLPGKLSKIGLGTFIDPRVEGGKMNERTRPLDDLIEVVTIGGEEYLLYKSIPLNFVIIRGTTADENGNITAEEEAIKHEILPAVLAAKRFGGKVICQVKRVAEAHSLDPKQVVVPGVFIDVVVVCRNPDEDHRQSSSWVYDPAYSGQLRVPLSTAQPLPLTVRKVIGRRAMMYLEPDAIINLGTGIPNDVVGPIAAEEGIMDEITITVESGVYGGIPAGGIDFGVAKNTDALIEHQAQFDFYNGAGVDFTFMGAGEMDADGHVNATKMGKNATGSGGFIDITQCAKHVVFCSTFTTGGLEVAFTDGKVSLVREGKIRKLVKNVQQISFNGIMARKREGQKVHFVTERCVFELQKDGPVLMEIAPGIRLEEDILAQMDFQPKISHPLKVTNEAIYSQSRFGLKEILVAKRTL